MDQHGRPLDRVSLTRPGLSVGKNGSIVALEARIGDWPSDPFEQNRLLAILRRNIVESESLLVHAAIEYNLLVSLHGKTLLDFFQRPAGSLAFVDRAHTDDNLDVVFLRSCAQGRHGRPSCIMALSTGLRDRAHSRWFKV